MTLQLLRRKFTVEQYHRIAEAGVLTEDERVELIRGEILEMSPIGRRHAACVNRLVSLFAQRLADQAVLSPQNPVELNNTSEPQPDLALLQPRPDFYESGHPKPADIFLLTEVADTTAKADRELKIPLYVEASIAEVWLIDITGQCIEVYRQPSPTGYQSVEKFQRGQTLLVQAFPDVRMLVDEVLG
ncbi:Uma2 family endonuclease [Leptolyngbya sp. FACHB-261]|uniref:Uma2 family endonuclease n=1 Tax=Leptolyngbya sp. FACHB-261 TaxID=2692806 RepID=UPI001686D60E|nr:Uma2 family endonuclease [Leptolyngbya sp. FACHB-261]MBD2099302.1 Uma2 family endonuclease [Leptolyngbya sp. FACHB-261]